MLTAFISLIVAIAAALIVGACINVLLQLEEIDEQH